jgi:hypothetical protein
MTQSDPTAATPTRTQRGKAANIALWVVQILFLVAGIVAWGRRGALKPALSRLGLVTS